MAVAGCRRCARLERLRLGALPTARLHAVVHACSVTSAACVGACTGHADADADSRSPPLASAVDDKPGQKDALLASCRHPGLVDTWPSHQRVDAFCLDGAAHTATASSKASV
eukprot:365694-Chlamydomonas_euryale.AAC.12